MTTRICHNCGKNYHNHLEYCPYCHALNIHYQEPQEKVKEEPRKGIEVHPCLKCGKVYDDNVEFCPYCHTVNRDYHPQTEIIAHKISASRVIKLICVGGIGLFLLVMLCGAISLCFYHPSSPSGSSYAGNAQVAVDSQTTVAVTSTSPTLQGTNDDQTFINAVERSGADLNPIIDKLSNAINANDYSTAGTLGFDLSAHAQFWYNKIDTMQVSSNYQDQKTSYLQALLDKKANGDDWASDASHHGAKVPSTSPTVEMTYRQTVTVSTPSQVNSLGVTAAPTIQSIPSTMQIVNGNTRNPQEYIPLSINGFSSDRGLESPIDNSLMEGGTTAIIVSYDPKTNSKYFGQFEYLVIQVYGFKNENLAEKTYQEAYKCDQPLTISGKQVTYEFDKSHGQTNICWRDKNNIILVGTGPINRNSPNEQAQKGANIYAAELVIQRAP